VEVNAGALIISGVVIAHIDDIIKVRGNSLWAGMRPINKNSLTVEIDRETKLIAGSKELNQPAYYPPGYRKKENEVKELICGVNYFRLSCFFVLFLQDA
jgi:hypothetical protein